MQTRTFYTSPDYKNQIQLAYDQILKEWPEPSEQKRISTRQGETFVISSGLDTNPDLILLHGSGSSSFAWSNTVHLLNHHFHVHCVDIPGDAGKSEEIRASWDGNEFVIWMEDIYSGLSLNKSAIAGVSLGGWIGTKWALNSPEMVSSLALISSSGFKPPRISFLFKVLIYKIMGDRGLKKLEQDLFHSKEIPQDVSDFFLLMAKGFRPRMGVPPIFGDSELRKLTMPVIFLGGEYDVLIDIEGSIKRLESLLPDFQSKVFPEKGHALTGFEKSLMEFLLKSHSPTT